ncbi:CE1759 family FMN reductase [Cellulosimicrobium arenosum]|uniref:NAD(P)H-dependent oxidoreductase n=1 Tax=Cellulosimicrobium arenosum TaxID=2708133 RepID=A0A927G6C8_9MICO|nr:CE1759 family FMN reductase [Cellulosimicrobium arenosum]MBD8077821.1 NAD(P)H-dependent oxidoreductase [Cellulosimicrobium arenosum]
MTGSQRRVVVVSAGLSEPSSTRLLADRLAAATVADLHARGVAASAETVELRPLAHAVVDAMLTGFATGELADVLDRLYAADAIVISTPLFTTTYSGLLKSFLDVLDRDALSGVPVLLGATGGTARHSLALEYSLRPLLTYLRADVVPTSVFAATDDWAAGEGDDGGGLAGRIARAGRELAERVAARGPAAVHDPFASVADFEDLLPGG